MNIDLRNYGPYINDKYYVCSMNLLKVTITNCNKNGYMWFARHQEKYFD